MLESREGIEDDLDGGDSIGKDDFPVAFSFGLSVGLIPETFHLLDQGGFTRFSGAKKQDFDFFPCIASILPELSIDGRATMAGISVLRRF